MYCTCAHAVVPSPELHCDGGPAPLPVSSYTTSTPPGVYTRSVVFPKQDAPEYSALHMDTVKVCPALAVTPHSAKFVTSALVLEALNAPHASAEVGATVGTALGCGLGAVGWAVGGDDATPGPVVGFAVGSDDGAGVGEAVVGSSVGRLLGVNEGDAVGVAVGANVGRAVGALLGVGVGIALGALVPD